MTRCQRADDLNNVIPLLSLVAGVIAALLCADPVRPATLPASRASRVADHETPSRPASQVPGGDHETQQAPEKTKIAGADPMSADSSEHWMLMDDGSFTMMLDRQGGPRGDTEIRAPNWWMGMASHRLGPGHFTGQLMLTLDPATVGRCGYTELFQAGETCHGRPLADRQHPHDLTSQLALVWTVSLADRTTLAVAGGPVGEPALGPVAYMHRPSAAGIPVAPLSHHTFDSTHVAMGVATLALERLPFTVEASVFNGREPDENRWNLMDRGPWDSWSARLWYRPSPEWQFQVSTGHLVAPEALEAGDIQRTTASLAWFRQREDGFSAITAGYGQNDKGRDRFNAMFVEATDRRQANEMYARFEALQVETDILATGTSPTPGHSLPTQTVAALTGGAVRQLARVHGFEVGVGADLTAYRVPPALVASHGARPLSFHVFLRVRPSDATGRMWNMTMTGLLMRQGDMSGHRMKGM